jgi:hypothetical protein
MPLILHTYSHLTEIQSEFSKKFPGLKLDFIFHGDEKLNLSTPLHHSFSNAPVQDLCTNCAGNDLTVDESMTTKEVEDLFENNWHLPAKVYVAIDGYWQKNRKTENSRLKECITHCKN